MLSLKEFENKKVVNAKEISGGYYYTVWGHPNGSTTTVYHWDCGHWDSVCDDHCP